MMAGISAGDCSIFRGEVVNRLEVESHEPFPVVGFGNFYIYAVVREQILYFFGPFDKAEGTAGKIVFGSEVVCLFDFVQTVAVEVVDKFAGGGRAVFVDDGEGGTVDRVFDAQFFAERFDKGGFAGTHIPVERKNGIVAHECDKLSGGFVYLVEVRYCKFVHGVIAFW